PFTYSINFGALTLGQGIRGIFSLSSHVQVSNFGGMARIGSGPEKIVLNVALSARAPSLYLSPRAHVGRTQATISCPPAFTRGPKSQSAICERTKRRMADRSGTASVANGLDRSWILCPTVWRIENVSQRMRVRHSIEVFGLSSCEFNPTARCVLCRRL